MQKTFTQDISIPPNTSKVTISYETSVDIGFGVNKAAINQAIAKLGALDTYRGYNTPANGIPTSWPGPNGGPIPAGTKTPIISIKPDLTKIGTAAATQALTAFAKLVPAGAIVTCWHEGERANENNSADTIKKLHEWAFPIFTDNAPDALYAQIFGGYSSVTNRITGWTVPGLDLYGFDTYPAVKGDSNTKQVQACYDQLKAAGLPDPTIAVTECNINQSFGGRPQFFEDMWTWAKTNGCEFFVPYFDEPTSTSGFAWQDSDTATINALKAIKAEAAA